LSRRRTFALLAIFAALAAVLSACGGGGGGSSSEDPAKVVESATFEGIKSGTIDVSVKAKSEGSEGGDVNIELSGPFQTTGAESLPELGLMVKASGDANGENIDFEGGLTVLGDRAYIAYKGKNYEVDPTTFGFIKSGFEEAEQEGATESAGGEATACQKAATGIDLNQFVDNLKNEGGEEVEGVETTKLSGELNPKNAVAAILKLVESPACSSELQDAGPLGLDELKEQSSELTEAIKKAHVEMNVGEDHIIRKLVADATIEPTGADEEGGEFELEMTLGKVNEKQSIKAPAGAEPIEKLFGELGVNPLELLGAMQGGEGAGLGELLEGVTGESSGGGEESFNPEEIEVPSTENLKELQECLQKAESTGSAAEIQKCASAME
jgi:hypothetical protein